ncbi:MAG: hypothetical protein K0R46_190 [Herbinix sp.]|nr:hypothetical protein [Herbinix sp.]
MEYVLDLGLYSFFLPTFRSKVENEIVNAADSCIVQLNVHCMADCCIVQPMAAEWRI